jgi:hypothetical protein
MGKLNKNEIEMLKKTHLTDSIFEITVAKSNDIDLLKMNDDDFYYGYFRRPNRQELMIFMNTAEKVSNMEAAEILMNTTFVAGDQEILKSDYHFLSAVSQIGALIETFHSSVKKN